MTGLLLAAMIGVAGPGHIQAISTADGLLLTWDRVPGAEHYQVYVLTDSGRQNLGTGPADKARFVDMDAEPGQSRTYIIETVKGDERGESAPFTAVFSPGWFDPSRLNVLVFLLLYSGVFFGFLLAARSGKPMVIRKIAGLEELDNAVGRSTEMGKPLLFVHGLGWIGDLTTIAALTVLKHIARKAAQYETKLLIPNNDPLVLAATQEVVKEAFTEAGRPDLYNDDDVFFVSPQQFAYAGAVNGIATREKPGAIFLMGYYYAESLMFAEVGQSVGAIQVAGTTATDQLPFFIAACDYTLIGEELYAASAYLSHDTIQIATLKAEDVFKLLFSLLILVGSVAEIFGLKIIFDLLAT